MSSPLSSPQRCQALESASMAAPLGSSPASRLSSEGFCLAELDTAACRASRLWVTALQGWCLHSTHWCKCATVRCAFLWPSRGWARHHCSLGFASQHVAWPAMHCTSSSEGFCLAGHSCVQGLETPADCAAGLVPAQHSWGSAEQVCAQN